MSQVGQMFWVKVLKFSQRCTPMLSVKISQISDSAAAPKIRCSCSRAKQWTVEPLRASVIPGERGKNGREKTLHVMASSHMLTSYSPPWQVDDHHSCPLFVRTIIGS